MHSRITTRKHKKNLAGVRTEGNINLTEDDKFIYTTIKTKVNKLIPKMTFNTWAKIKKNEYLQEINQAIAVGLTRNKVRSLKTQAMTKPKILK